MNWFNPTLPAAEALCSDFDHYAYFPSDCASDGRNAERQIAWSLERIAASEKPFFLFLNLGETHSPYTAAGHSPADRTHHRRPPVIACAVEHRFAGVSRRAAIRSMDDVVAMVEERETAQAAAT